MTRFAGWAAVGLVCLFGLLAGAQEMPKPGPEHALLKQMEGTWDGAVKLVAEPGKPAMESKGVLTSKMDLGGFFLVTEFKGEMMGQNFTGKGMSGYDPTKKKYVGTWADSMGPWLMFLEGSFDKAGKTYTEIGDGPDMTGATVKYKMVTQIKGKDAMHFTVGMVGKDGKDQTVMTIDYKRKK